MPSVFHWNPPHVPDPIGWLHEVGEILADDAPLVLVVPDKRYCFDLYHQRTSSGR
jgi:hypothetical protein